MSHPEQLAFFEVVAARNRELVRGGRVLEVGSFDVNGSVRNRFSGSVEYVGVDLAVGPGVDLVAFGHELDMEDGYFDVSLSGECFEHDPHWPETLRNMTRLTRPGGLVAFTCASTGRPEHGTRRTDLTESPGTQARELDYYRNLTAADVRGSLPLDELFTAHRFWYLPTSFDLYFAGVRAGNETARPIAVLPGDHDIEPIHGLMPPSHRLVRLPLRALARLLPERRYQDWAVPYWQTVVRLQDRLFRGRFRRADGDTIPAPAQDRVDPQGTIGTAGHSQRTSAAEDDPLTDRSSRNP